MDRYCTECGKITEKKDSNLFICVNEHRNYLNPAPATVVYIVKSNKVLFGHRSIEPNKGGLDAPGGFLDIDETAEQSAIREVREELGIDIAITDYLGSYTTDYADANKPVLCMAFIAEYIGGDITPGDDMNGGNPVWRAFDNLPSLDELSWDWQIKAQEDLQKWASKRYNRVQ